MPTLLVELVENKMLNRTFFPAHLYIYNDLLIYKKRNWFVVKEITFSYNQIAQVNLVKGILFSELGVITTGAEDVEVHYVSTRKAVQAKKILDQKVYHAHSIHKEEKFEMSAEISGYEKSLSRLNELLQKDKISKGEYEKRKRELLKRVR